jgi:hypothetical protein
MNVIDERRSFARVEFAEPLACYRVFCDPRDIHREDRFEPCPTWADFRSYLIRTAKRARVALVELLSIASDASRLSEISRDYPPARVAFEICVMRETCLLHLQSGSFYNGAEAARAAIA